MEFLSDDLQEYIRAHTTKAPDYLDELERETWVKVLMPRMLSGHVQGQILKQFSIMKRPKYLLEVGTFTGICFSFFSGRTCRKMGNSMRLRSTKNWNS